MHSRVFGRPLSALWAAVALALSLPVVAGPYSGLVVEVESERVLYEKNSNELRYPASLTKMMTLYLVFEALSQGRLSLSDTMVASAFATSKPPSRLGLLPGDTLTVEEGILGLVTQSANDAATVIAETLGGSEPAFAEMMTQKARQLGMSSTVFRNAQGLPDSGQVTTAWDMYRLGKALLKNFPEYYHYFSTESFWFKNRSFHNHNHLLNNYAGTDGIKTGFINASGFNLVASAKRNGMRLIGVVFGGATHARRDAHMRAILDDGFAQLEGRESSRVAGLDEMAPRNLLPRPSDMEREVANQVEEPAVHSKIRGAKKQAARAEERKSSWEVRVGTFSQVKEAEQRLAVATKTAPYAFRHAKGAVMSHIHRGKKTYIAYFNGLSKEDADLACQFLRRKKLECSASLSG